MLEGGGGSYMGEKCSDVSLTMATPLGVYRAGATRGRKNPPRKSTHRALSGGGIISGALGAINFP